MIYFSNRRIDKRRRKAQSCEICGKSLGKKYTQMIQHMYLRHGVPFKVNIKQIKAALAKERVSEALA